MLLDTITSEYARNNMTHPTVITTYDIENREIPTVEEKHIEEKKKEMVMIFLLIFNCVLLLTLIFLFLIPVHKSRNCYT